MRLAALLLASCTAYADVDVAIEVYVEGDMCSLLDGGIADSLPECADGGTCDYGVCACGVCVPIE